MTDSPLTYLDDEERDLIESIEGEPRLGRPLDPRAERELRELLKIAARRRPKDLNCSNELLQAEADTVQNIHPANGLSR